MKEGRWCFLWAAPPAEDCAWLYSLSRTYQTFNDMRGQEHIVSDKDDASEWKKRFDGLGNRPLLAFALAIDFNQEPAMRAMEANRWKLVATGLRGHDRQVSGEDAFARLYMKKFPKTGKVRPAPSSTWNTPNPSRLAMGIDPSCSFSFYDYEAYNHKETMEITVRSSGYGDGKSMILHRIPQAKITAGFKIPDDIKFVTETKFAAYYLQNSVEMFVRRHV